MDSYIIYINTLMFFLCCMGIFSPGKTVTPFLFLAVLIFAACSTTPSQQPKESTLVGECKYRMNDMDVPTLCRFAYQCEMACRDICQADGLYYKRQSYKPAPAPTKGDSYCNCTCTDIPTEDSRVVSAVDTPEGFPDAKAS